MLMLGYRQCKDTYNFSLAKTNQVVFLSYLVTVDAIVDRPGCLKVLQHSLLEALRQMMDTYEVLEIFGFGVVQRPA